MFHCVLYILSVLTPHIQSLCYSCPVAVGHSSTTLSIVYPLILTHQSFIQSLTQSFIQSLTQNKAVGDPAASIRPSMTQPSSSKVLRVTRPHPRKHRAAGSGLEGQPASTSKGQSASMSKQKSDMCLQAVVRCLRAKPAHRDVILWWHVTSRDVGSIV